MTFSFSENLGRQYENLVAIELLRRDAEFYYWRERGKEVDFVVRKGTKVKNLIQVCWNVEDEVTREREVKALLDAMEAFHLGTGLVITEDYQEEEKHGRKKVRYVPLWRFLLGKWR